MTLPQFPQGPNSQGGYPQPGQNPQPAQPAPGGYAPPTSPAGYSAPQPSSRPVPLSAAPRALNAGTAPAGVGAAPSPLRPVRAPKDAKKAMRVDDRKRDDEEDEPGDLTKKLSKGAPPWLVSFVVHLVMLIIMGLIYIHIDNDSTKRVSLEAIYAEQIGEQLEQMNVGLIADEPTTNTEEIITPDNLPPVDDPLAAMPQIEVTSLEGSSISTDVTAPQIGLAFSGRSAGSKKQQLAKYGGTATTEKSVRAALLWLRKNQASDGSWSLVGPYTNGAQGENKIAATSMALIAFQGAGHSTKSKSEFTENVSRGWSWLLKQQGNDGDFFANQKGNDHHHLYAHCQATIAICEHYGMTKDEAFQKPAQAALNFVVRAQDPKLGGWRYQPQVDSDVSVTGWGLMAMQSGLMAGLTAPSPSFELVNKYLDLCTPDGSHYSYQPGKISSPTMTAEALLCRHYLGWKSSDPRMLAGTEHLLQNPIVYSPTEQNVYYWYYASQVLHHVHANHPPTSKMWFAWNKIMHAELPKNQVLDGGEAGSWGPTNDQWGHLGGRLYTTCLTTYCLQVYYRHFY